MKKAFISSVMSGFEEYRSAVRDALDLMDLQSVMAENFGSRSYSSDVACVSEAQNCDLFLLVLSKNYGFEVESGLSVTHIEYRAAREAGKKILVFIQEGIEDPKQRQFKSEVEEYYDGYFRATFESPKELKDEVVKSLRQLEREESASVGTSLEARIQEILAEKNIDVKNDSRAIVAFWGQPPVSLDLNETEKNADQMFAQLCKIGATKMRAGYELKSWPKSVDIESENTTFMWYRDGVKVLVFPAEPEPLGSYSFGMFHVSPKKFSAVAEKYIEFAESRVSWVYVGLFGMQSKYFAEEDGQSNSTTIPMSQEPSEAAAKLFSPLTSSSYKEWLYQQVEHFKRVYSKPN